MIPLELESGEFIYSPYSKYHAFICRGDLDFLERAYNLINNFSPAPKSFYKFDEMTRYFVIPEEELINILSLYYCGQLALIRNPDPLTLNTFAREKAILFWEQCVVKMAFFAKKRFYSPETYSLGYINFHAKNILP
jgi:hypothetical protein